MATALYDAIDEARRIAVTDTLANLVSGMGTDRDKGAHGRFVHNWLDQGQLEAMYRNDWIAGTIVDAPANDMTREWRTWNGGKNQVAAMKRTEKKFSVRAKVNKALKQARAYGGGAILIGDGCPDPSQPLDLDSLPKGGLNYLHVLSRNEIHSGPLCRDPASMWFGEPEWYTLATPTPLEGGCQVHPSRVVRFVGLEPLETSRQIDCWGDSVLQRAYDAIRNASATGQGLAALVQEAKIDVVQIKNLTERAVDAGWRRAMLQRFELANRAKSIQGMLLLDAEETYEQKTIGLADLPKVMMAFLEVCAGAGEMPVTRLLGRSPGGLGSDGSGEIRHYYDTLSSRQEIEVGPPLERLDMALKRHALGAASEALDYEWNPLWQHSDAELAAIALQDAQALQVLVATGVVPFAALAVAAQAQLVRSGRYPGLAAALETEIAAGRQVTAPPADDGSKVKNPALSSKTAPLGDAA